MAAISAEMSVADIVRTWPATRRVFDRHGLHGCGGDTGPSESLEFFARVHEVDLDALRRELRGEIEDAAGKEPSPVMFRETLADFIYRRFFKAGIAVVLTVGALWGAVNLLQIALDKNFLQLRLIPAIHAHAHAMIFGWVGLFVMGFAYQSFPRFKNTVLWRPDLANLSLVLMLVGIAARMTAELLLPQPVALGLGAAAGASELAAVALFFAIVLNTARKSIGPRNPYERFILAALGWFLVQAILSDAFFFAKATAVSARQLIERIALIDGPLRDIQLLGLAALMIAGVSQRFVPLVYNLARPRRDRQKLIFWLMNGSLVLDVVSYVLFLSTRNLIFALSLEASFLLMFVWAALLVRQLGIFTKPGQPATAGQPDRTWKFIRAAYTWLLAAQGMLPFLIVYGVLTHQGFAHSFAGATRHAYTVGFVSLMIMGVSARVIPILAGVEPKQVSSLMGPFVLINVGCAGRVVLQILTDFIPNVAYPLVGLTGLLEVVALAWWGIEQWRVMNLARTHRPRPLHSPLPFAA